MDDNSEANKTTDIKPQAQRNSKTKQKEKPVLEFGGPSGPEPTRYGDWEKKGRCIDF